MIWRPFHSLESLIQRTKTRVNVTLTSVILSSFCLPLSSTSFSLGFFFPSFLFLPYCSLYSWNIAASFLTIPSHHILGQMVRDILLPPLTGLNNDINARGIIILPFSISIGALYRSLALLSFSICFLVSLLYPLSNIFWLITIRNYMLSLIYDTCNIFLWFNLLIYPNIAIKEYFVEILDSDGVLMKPVITLIFLI